MIRRKPHHDPVTWAVRDAVLSRDRKCLAWRLDPNHICRGRWGNVHAPDDLLRLTLDHVHDAARMGKRAPSDLRHLLALCWDANVNGWASAHRQEERSYLQAVSEPEHTHVDPQPGCIQCFEVFG